MSGELDYLFDDSPSGVSMEDLLGEMGAEYPDVDGIIASGIASLQKVFDDIRPNGFHPSFIAGRTCLNAYVHSLSYDSHRGTIAPSLQRIFDNGSDVHSRLQKYAARELWGTWLCRACGKVHHQNSLYIEWLEKRVAEMNLAGEDTSRFVTELSHVHSIASGPQPIPAKCGCCGAPQTSMRYYEWRVFDTRYGVTGRTDGLFVNHKGDFVGWEIKSANSRSFDSLNLRSPLMRKYLKQFGIYLYIMGLEYGIVTIECKDNQRLKHFPVRASDIDVQTELVTMLSARRINDGKDALPEPMEFEECKDCPYNNGKICIPKKPVGGIKNA